MVKPKKKQDKRQETSTKSYLDRISEEVYERFFRANKKINPFKYDFVINGSAICNKTSPFLIILIPSIPNNKEVRNAIRTTWGSIAKGGVWPRKSLNVKIKLAFLLGMSEPENLTLTKLINQESTTYGDLTEGNFTDSYYNLTLKVLLGLKWVTLFCNNANFLVKADEDTFVNLPKLIEILNKQRVSPEGKILGHLNLRSPVLRSDVFITGMLAKSINTTVAALPGVAFWGEKAAISCDFVLDKKISGSTIKGKVSFCLLPYERAGLYHLNNVI
ncbi:hypothetical protein KUTeg_004601 [Tegillarca granosa]|uniref:Hexosyltransferase n=1 Tax=Tegillarca granosa TaxID=220873 RepID=A0ABQ9FT97_TEGGR|nr:hypothetical protein KUTeg_004601 [Tegillarca granosa]